MGSVAVFTIPSEALPFGDTLVENPDIRIEIERIVPTTETALPFFWVWGDSPEQFMDAAEREPEITDIRLLDRVTNGALFRADWSPNAAIISGIKALNATIIEAEGTADQWRFEIRAQDHDRFNEFQRIFQEQGIPISLVRLYDLAELVEGNRRPLTAEQRETLITAYKEGYYDKPRQVTQAEIGNHFGVGHRAVSERLRRGTRNLIAATLLPSGQQS